MSLLNIPLDKIGEADFQRLKSMGVAESPPPPSGCPLASGFEAASLAGLASPSMGRTSCVEELHPKSNAATDPSTIDLMATSQHRA